MANRRLAYKTVRKHLTLRKDLVEFFEGAVLAKPEENRIGYGFNKILDELMEKRRDEMLASARAAANDGYGPQA